MAQKNSHLTKLLLILLLALILIMGYFLYNLYTTNQINSEKINTLNSEISNFKNTINDLKLVIENNNENTAVTNIILEGSYGLESSDMSYKFSANGNVEYTTNTTNLKGTYTTIAQNQIEISFTEKIVWDDVTGEKSTTKINQIHKIIVIDKNTLTFNAEVDGQQYSGTIIKLK